MSGAHASARNFSERLPGEAQIVLVARPTRLDDLVVRHNTVQQAQFYVEHLGADFSDYMAEHRRYRSATGRLSTP